MSRAPAPPVFDVLSLEEGGEAVELALGRPPRFLRLCVYLLAGAVAAALVWAWLSKVDLYISSVGAVRPRGRLVKVQSFLAGRVVDVHVKEGDEVRAGDLLFRLDGRDAQTELAEIRNRGQSTRRRLESQSRAREALLEEQEHEAARDRIAIDNAVANRERAVELWRSRQAELAQAEEILAQARQEASRTEKLLSDGITSQAAVDAARSKRRVAQTSRQVAAANLGAARKGIASAEKEHELLVRRAKIRARERSREAEVSASEMNQTEERIEASELAGERLEANLEYLEIEAPIDGVVTSVAVRNPGEVLQLGATVATLAPLDSEWVVEAFVSNRDAGELRQHLGAPVKLKFDAFPFRDYGTLGGRLVEVPPDAELHSQLGQAYRVKIAMDSLELGRGRRHGHVQLGMTVTAEIVKEEERLLLLLLRTLRDRVSYE